MEESKDKRRIAELEAELASLRAKVEQDDGEGQDFEPEPSRAKVLLLSALVVVVGLLLILAIFTALSKGFDRFADKAAKQFVPPSKEPAAAQDTKLAPDLSPPTTAPPAPDAGASKILVPGI